MHAPPDFPPAAGHRLGRALVAAQFSLLGVLALASAPHWWALRAPAAAWALLLAGAGIGLWALAANRPGNFNIHPAPRDGGTLVAHGPYRWVRHPMYTGVGAVAAGCALALGRPWAALAWLALCAVLLAKAALEERWMRAHHPDYAAYAAGTRRFLPGLY
jgi:protein-S-isoprenylcysteine O-methyltransferase Ste14